ncbi:ubiquinol-cytochrome C chaperone [Pseudolabrys taiwanensis]|uniref:Ubiquinol-cytochrome C chaperone n=2 Tax=Pseudolabrys taiwanensis TaxID=331696 RepID=A0A345ZTI6_9HYPH|nr:ubiquinol-cytochrome C chaperone [Pseudolabrys taiwanensis]
MIFPLFRRNRRADTISALYGMIVAQARMPSFYQDFVVADTINGRFDLLVLHLVLVIERLNREEGVRDLAQGLFDRFCRDMDDNLREIGIADLKVPKEMRKMGQAFYGRAQAYQAALATPDNAALVETLVRNIYAGSAPSAAVTDRLAAYVRDAIRALDTQETSALESGKLHLPDPARSFAVA